MHQPSSVEERDWISLFSWLFTRQVFDSMSYGLPILKSAAKDQSELLADVIPNRPIGGGQIRRHALL
jgi:hypothetical protein